jgi:hypothetical protein
MCEIYEEIYDGMTRNDDARMHTIGHVFMLMEFGDV